MFRSAIWRAKTESTLHLDVSVFVCVKGKKREREIVSKKTRNYVSFWGGNHFF